MKGKVDFQKFERSLPYASEAYGVYQPLLGWKSNLISQRRTQGVAQTWPTATPVLLSNMQSRYSIGDDLNPRDVQFEIEPAIPDSQADGY